MNTDLSRPISNERMSSVILDLEAQNNLIDDNTERKEPLKGILKKDELNSEDSNELELKVVKICSTIIFIILIAPIIVCDLYFGFTDNSCINESPDELYYTMKLYLLVSGFTGLAALILLICVTCSLSMDDDKNVKNLFCIRCIGLFGLVFNIIWNILGAVTFWGSIITKGNCNKMISTYIYVSLIIKFVGNFVSLREQFKNKK